MIIVILNCLNESRLFNFIIFFKKVCCYGNKDVIIVKYFKTEKVCAILFN